MTVQHWDLRLALQREGAWARRGIVEDFAAFAEELARRYGDRVAHWMVFNEPASVLGHTVTGLHTRYGPHPVEALETIHHINLACAEAGRRMRNVPGSDARIGAANVATVASPLETDDPRTQRAQRAYEAMAVRVFMDPPGGLGYPFEDAPLLRPLKRYVEDGDMEAVAFDYDFMGMQYYGPIPLKRAPIPSLGGVPTMVERGAEDNVRSAVGLPVEPRGLLQTLRRYRDHPPVAAWSSPRTASG